MSFSLLPILYSAITVVFLSSLSLMSCQTRPSNDLITTPSFSTITREKITSIDDQDLAYEVYVDILEHSPESEWQGMANLLTPGQRALCIVLSVEGEVNNGGFNQYYYNPSGQNADEAEAAFTKIGAIEYADIMREANLLYDSIKQDLEKKDDGTMESFSKSYENNPLNALDTKFYELETAQPLLPIIAKFIRENIDQFAKN